MKKNQFLSILEKLSKREVNELQDYIHQLHPRKKQQQQLLNCLLPFHPLFEAEKEITESIKQAELSDENNSKKLSNLMSDLKGLVLEFLLWKEQQVNSFEKSLTLIQLLHRRGIHHVAAIELKKLEKRIKKNKKMLSLDLYQLLKLKYFQLDIHSQANTAAEHSITKTFKQLNTFYLTNSYKLFCEVLSRKNVYQENIPADKATIEQLLDSKLARKDSDLLVCYQKALTMNFYQAESAVKAEAVFQDLKELYKNVYEFFDLEDQQTLLLYLINFCIPRVMKGQSDYEMIAFNLHEFGFNKFIFQKGGLSKTLLLNTITIGCRAQKKEANQDWQSVQTIIAENIEYLPKKDRIPTEILANSFITFYQSNYEDTLYQLNTISVSEDTDNSLRVRGMVTISLYKLNRMKALVRELDKFENFLKKNTKKISDIVKIRYLNFIEIMRLISKPNYDKAFIKQKIETYKNGIYGRDFLLDQLKDEI